MQPQKKVE